MLVMLGAGASDPTPASFMSYAYRTLAALLPHSCRTLVALLSHSCRTLVATGAIKTEATLKETLGQIRRQHAGHGPSSIQSASLLAFKTFTILIRRDMHPFNERAAEIRHF